MSDSETTPDPSSHNSPAEPLDPIDPDEDDSDSSSVPTDPEVVADPEVPTEDGAGEPGVVIQPRSS